MSASMSDHREVLIFDEPEPQPQPFPGFPSLEVDLGEERDPEPPIKPPSQDSFRMKEVDHLTIHIPPSPHVASFHLKDTYCYYHPCIDDLKKHYGFKPVLSSDLTNKIACRKFLIKNEEGFFLPQCPGDGVGINNPRRRPQKHLQA
ncbi:hypothetical protein Tco_0456665 [Tanacetum coccineum]